MNVEVVDEYQLETLLNSLNMDQLKNIRRNLELKNMSSLRKKELVVALSEHIPQSVVSRVELMDVDQYAAILRLMSKSGIIEMDQLEMEDVFYLSSIGYIHPAVQEEQPILVMPKEVMDQLFKLDPTHLKALVNKNQKITNLLFGMVRYYGVVELTVAQAIIEKHIGEGMDTKWFKQYVSHLESYYDAFRLSNGYVVNELVEDEEALIQTVASKEELDYYAIPEEVMYTMNRHEQFDRMPQVKELMQYVNEHYDVPAEVMEEIINECMLMVQSGQPFEEVVGLFAKYLHFKDMADLQRFIPVVLNVLNHTRIWTLKGHTVLELSPQSMNSNEVNTPVKVANKVGRNEPCPCGSGKKYKKCCGK